jgi:E3 ubiquitin-protein ligase MARCH6
MEGGEDVVADQKDVGEPEASKPNAQTHEGTFGGSNEEGDYCRICRGEATDDLPLFYPCKCSGSIKFVHQDCLMEWLSHSQKKHCELCKTPFRFTKLYDHRMPQTLPLPLFIRQICLHAVRNTLRWIRYLLVGLVWLGWLPWSIRQVWRGLFWLADGSWGDMMNLDGNPSSRLQDLRNSTTDADVTAALSINATEELVNALPQMVAPISGFLGYSSSEFLLIKIVRFLYPNLFNWSAGLIQAGPSNSTTFIRASDRQPSFLSDVRYLKTLTSYQTINQSVIDVLEGQLICLLIVTAFILIFLIREWVINQQPAVALPADDRLDDVRPAVGDGALRGHARRRRGRGVDEGREERVRRIAVPRARRRLGPPEAEREQGNVEAPEMPADGRTDDAEGLGMNSSSSVFRVEYQPTENHEEPSTVVRPPMQARNSQDDVASIRRTIEEGIPSRNSPEWPGLETFKELWNRADHDPAKVLSIIREENREGELGWIVAQMERLQQHPQPRLELPLVKAEDTPRSDYENTDNDIIHETGVFALSSDSPPQLYWPDENPQRLETDDGIIYEPGLSTLSPDSPPQLSSPGKDPQKSEEEESMRSVRSTERSPSETWDMMESAEAPVEPFSNLTTAPYLPESDVGSPAASTTAEPDNENPGEQHEASNTAVVVRNPDTIPQDHNLDHLIPAIDALADWLWQTDEYPPQADEQFDEVNAHLVEDVDQDAPFIPIPLAEVASDTEDEVQAEQNAEVVAAAAAAGIDLNNAEAIEDAEDLDGILELIGMQGPLTGMVQNVIFSEFLISLTLAMSVWLPYIWGKIALLLLANPVGVFVKAPLHLISLVANTSVDISLFISGICVYMLKFGLDFLVYLVSLVHPVSHSWINTNPIGKISLSLASGSGSRLEKAIFQTFGGLKPDLPAFSVLSHQALYVFQHQLVIKVQTIGQFLVYIFYGVPLRLKQCIHGGVGVNKCTIYDALHFIVTSYRQTVNDLGRLYQGLCNLRSLKLGVEKPLDTSSLDYSLVRWSTKDRVIAILIGYAFFAFVGYLYIKISRLVLGLKKGDKVEGVVADSLKQAGGVMKVILIIGIEMIVFPLYCGFLLDVALMPLFEGVGFQSRLAFVMNAPITAIFVHWFVGTCYMFHFALFVAMCRKIMRRGVLYFIRDPDDPTFHPVRDVLERPIAIQLSKIAFSGLVYGGLVILCLGGIVWVVSRVEGIFPIHWTSNEPILEFPIDLLFYNFLLPILIRSVEPSKKINAMYEWWFRKCARWLRLSNFLFNEQKDDEQGQHVKGRWSALFQRKQSFVDAATTGEDNQPETNFIRDGTFVRAPGSDSVRIPKGGRVFLEVDDENKENDDPNDEDQMPHGIRNDNFVKVYIPPMFRTRIAAFVILVWVFAAVSGIVFTIAPLSLGRKCILFITQGSRPPNDLYAFSVGLYLCGSVVYVLSYYGICREWLFRKIDHYFKDTRHAFPRLWSSFVYFGGLAYMGITFGFILPFLFSTLVELYFVAPLHTYLTSTYTPRAPTYNYPALPPTIHVIQTWTLGLVYLRVIVRLVTNQPDPQTRAATAIQSILRQGFWRPDIRLASRAFVLPSLVISSILLVTPLGLGWTINVMLGQPELQAKVYRYAYPGILGVALALHCAILLKRQVGVWRTRVRDEVYLIGERLHNFGEAQRRQGKGKGKARVGDLAVSERLQIR